MTADEDRDLKSAFEALGSSGVTGPSFSDLTSREALGAARSRRRHRWAAQLTIPVVILALVFFRAPTARTLDYERFTALTGIDLAEVTWEAPSDFLLDFPGRNVLWAIPAIDVQPITAPNDERPSNSNDTTRRSRS